MPTVNGIYYKNLTDKEHILVQMSMDSQAYVTFGAPQNVWLEYSFSKQKPHLDISLKWFQKTASRSTEPPSPTYDLDCQKQCS